MNQHGHKQPDHHNHGHADTRSGIQKHGKWFVLAVVLMLIGIAVYVMTLDEAIVPPGDGPGEVVPAAP